MNVDIHIVRRTMLNFPCLFFSPLFFLYCAWRGVLDFSKIENSEKMAGIRKAYPDLGKCCTLTWPQVHTLSCMSCIEKHSIGFGM